LPEAIFWLEIVAKQATDMSYSISTLLKRNLQDIFGEGDPERRRAAINLIRKHVQGEKLLFSVCTGALLCGAAGVLAGRQVTTHWSVRHLIPHYGAVVMDARVVVDGNFISAAGVTAGLDAALVLVSLLRGDAAAQEIQLAIEYAPNPVFNCGTPESAPHEVLQSFQAKYEPIGTAREAEAIRYASINHGVWK
jgi:cyclohexyl-isocyanide hydratase